MWLLTGSSTFQAIGLRVSVSSWLWTRDHPQVLSGGPSARGNLLHQNSQGTESTGKTEVRLINIQLSYRLQESYPGERVCSRPWLSEVEVIEAIIEVTYRNILLCFLGGLYKNRMTFNWWLTPLCLRFLNMQNRDKNNHPLMELMCRLNEKIQQNPTKNVWHIASMTSVFIVAFIFFTTIISITSIITIIITFITITFITITTVLQCP